MELNPLTDQDVAALATSLSDERRIMEESETDQARRIFIQHSPVAAMQICRMATNATSERMRFQAATYVLDRSMGRLQDANHAPADSPLDIMMREIVSETDLATIRKQVRGVAPDAE